MISLIQYSTNFLRLLKIGSCLNWLSSTPPLPPLPPPPPPHLHEQSMYLINYLLIQYVSLHGTRLELVPDRKHDPWVIIGNHPSPYPA
jgi:hypothetical protein